MAEYFGITEGTYKVDANPIIDFSAVSKAITEGIDKNEQERERQRKEDLKITQDNIAEIENLSYGSDQDMNQIMTKYGYNVKDTMMGWYKELLAQRMSRREFALKSQNLLNGTKSAAAASKGFNETNQKYVDLLNSGDASAMSQYTAKKIADIQMLNNKSMVIDPNTGTVNWAAVDENNRIIPNSVSDIKTILNLRNNLEKKVNVPEEVSKLAGTKIEDFKKAYGPYVDINDPRVRDEYKKLQASTADYILSTPSRSADVLVNFSAKGYYLTDDAKDNNPLAIKVIKDVNGITRPVPTDAQLNDAKDAIYRSIDSQMPYERTQEAPPVRAPRPSGGGDGGPKDNQPEITISTPVMPITEQKDASKKVIAKGRGIQYPVSMEPMSMAGTGYTEQITAFGVNGFGNPYITVTSYRGKETGGTQDFGPTTGGGYTTTTSGSSVKTKETRVIYLNPVGKGVSVNTKAKNVVSATDFGKYKTFLEQRGIDFNELTRGYGTTKKASTKEKVVTVKGKKIIKPI
jgi:hypothetical protein